MIKFFRHIRKSLIEQNQMGKYFKYAIGEILLVVIGILIALQINNWNENRKKAKEEQAILANLLEEFQFNLKGLNRIKMQHTLILNANSELLNHTRPNPKNYQPQVLDSLLGLTMISPLFNYKDGSLNSVISSGKLGLIKNEVLRTKVAQFPGIIRDGTFNENALRDILIQNYIPIVEQHVALKKLFRASGIFRDQLPQPSEFKSDLDMLLTRKEFEDALMFNFGVINVVLGEYGRFEQELNQVISLIEDELKDD